MALLSADDVLNKSFQTTKFRDGYDQDEVDDFLDEVVSTMRAVYAENEELKAKLGAAEGRIAELSRSESADAAFAPAPAEAPAPEPEPEPEPVVEAAPVAAAAPAAVPASDSATGMLALAQKLHDQYVAEGREESDRIIAEARATAEQIVSEAESTRDTTLTQLNDERSSLEHKIDELRNYERTYRQRMKDYLGKLLSDMDASDLESPEI